VDPVSMILAALSGGAAAGVTEAASTAVKDAYQSLREILRRSFARDPDAQAALEGYEVAPGRWEARLASAVAETDQARQAELAVAAQRLLTLLDPGKYTVDLRQARGVQVGDGNVQHNTFS